MTQSQKRAKETQRLYKEAQEKRQVKADSGKTLVRGFRMESVTAEEKTELLRISKGAGYSYMETAGSCQAGWLNWSMGISYKKEKEIVAQEMADYKFEKENGMTRQEAEEIRFEKTHGMTRKQWVAERIAKEKDEMTMKQYVAQFDLGDDEEGEMIVAESKIWAVSEKDAEQQALKIMKESQGYNDVYMIYHTGLTK